MSLRTLSRLERRWAGAALCAIFPAPPPGAGARLGLSELDVDGFLTSTFARIPLEPALGLRIAIWIVALAPIFVLGRFATILALSAAERERVLTHLVVSKVYVVRQLVLALKAIGAMLYVAPRGARPIALRRSARDGRPAQSAGWSTPGEAPR
jgi:hypothetical protein